VTIPSDPSGNPAASSGRAADQTLVHETPPMKRRYCVSAFLLMCLACLLAQPAPAQTPGSSDSGSKGGSGSSSSDSKPATPSPAHATILKDAKTVSGLWTVYQKANNLYWEISPGDYGSAIQLISISRGNFGNPYGRRHAG
jgi:hypothetical protein